MAIKKKKISEFPLAETLVGLFTIGVDKLNKSVKVSLEFLKTAADQATSAATAANTAKTNADKAATAANNAAKSADAATTKADTATAAANKATTAANTAASNANTKATAADGAATAASQAAANANAKAAEAGSKAADANNAASIAQQTTSEARATIVRLEELEQSLVGQYKMIPTDMVLEYPSRITLRNTVPNKIGYSLLPTNTGRNVLFLGDDNAVSVVPDGSLIVRKPGISKIHVIPTENTALYKTIEITVVEPVLRKVKASSLRIMGNGTFRLT
ncbi:hypothetical protein [Alistipes putredinis]|uniref:hypothetical protein n=1 Tax=Alistipes putredinis TaxID=28117 RepID=UPI00242DAB9B|nr:hypothetical protein [Alistipes putredinis]